jgi:hypothetical protein
MSDFDFELKQAFDAQEEPADAGFAEAIVARVQRRETRSRWLGFVGLGALSAAVAGAAAPMLAQLADGASAPSAAAQAGAAGFAETLSTGLVEGFGWISAVSPLAFFITAVSAGAIAYVAQRR